MFGASEEIARERNIMRARNARAAKDAEQAALIKGIRMGLEAAAREADGNRTADGSSWDCAAAYIARAILALDPNTIAKDAGHE